LSFEIEYPKASQGNRDSASPLAAGSAPCLDHTTNARRVRAVAERGD
jgi:hypothetical protein